MRDAERKEERWIKIRTQSRNHLSNQSDYKLINALNIDKQRE